MNSSEGVYPVKLRRSAKFSNLEHYAIVFLTTILLLNWMTACITDINYPPHARTIRLATAMFLVLIGVAEICRPWLGFKTFLLIWPQGLLIRELLSLHVSPAFVSMPTFWGGPLAGVLVLAYCWRTREKTAGDNDSSSGTRSPDRWVQLLRYGLWFLTAAWIASAIFGSIRLIHPGPEWQLGNGWRLFLTPGMSVWTPLQSTTEILLPLLLGLVLINRSALGPSKDNTHLSTSLLTFASIGMGIAAIEILFCYYRDFAFSFDRFPPSGPFGNRNTAGPVCVLASAIAVLLLLRNPAKWLKVFWLIVGALSLLAGCYSASRNAYFLMLCAILLAYLYRPSRLRWITLLVMIAAGAVVAYTAPLPSQEFIQKHPALGRFGAALADLRQGEFNNLSSFRLGLWITAWHIFVNFPLFGSGPGTFGMLAYPGSPFGSSLPIDAYLSAHSVPINLLAECGLIAASAWCLVWLLIPLRNFFKGPSNPWTVITLLIGLANLVDTTWLVPGITTFACCACSFSVILGDRREDKPREEREGAPTRLEYTINAQ